MAPRQVNQAQLLVREGGGGCKWESSSLMGTGLPKLTRPFSGAGSIYLPALDRNIKRAI